MGGDHTDRGSNTTRDAEPVPATDELALSLTASLPCIECGYELKGLSVTGDCPECGTPVRLTLAYAVGGDRFVDVLPTKLVTPATGILVIGAGVFVTVLSLAIATIGFLVSYSWQQYPPITLFHDGLAAVALTMTALVAVCAAACGAGLLVVGTVRAGGRASHVFNSFLIEAALALIAILVGHAVIATLLSSHGSRWGPHLLPVIPPILLLLLLITLGLAYSTRMFRMLPIASLRRTPHRLLALAFAILVAFIASALQFLGHSRPYHPPSGPTALVSYAVMSVAGGFVLLGFLTLTRDAYLIRKALRHPPRTLGELTAPSEAP